MARRRQLADVADGISGHLVRDTPWDRLWPIGEIGRAFDASGDRGFTIDLLLATVTPPSRHLDRLSARLVDDLARHMAARKLPGEWLSSGKVELWVSDGAARRTVVVRCRVSLVDDRGRVHTSTRTGAGRIPVRPLGTFLRDVFLLRGH